jgi:ceramide glucosyltransferase
MIVFALIFACTVATLLSIASVWAVTRRCRLRSAGAEPPISVLKPLCGADDSLAANLETFFAQRYPDFELLFGVADANDPAIPVVEKLIAAHPLVKARVVVHGQHGLNPKVANLRGTIAAGAHDLVVISDSNIAVGPDYLANLAARMSDGHVGLVTSLFAGAGERSLGATLESLHLAGPVAGGIATSEIMSGNAVCVGKSMMFRRSVFESLGGMESVASVLAEDYVMGRMFKEAGWEVRVCAEVVQNVTVKTSVSAFWRRQARWGLLRSRIKPFLYPLEPLANPMAVAFIVMLLAHHLEVWPLEWAMVLIATRDALQWARLRGWRGLPRALPLGPVKELLLLGAWAVAPWKRKVSWRGHRLRVSAGTRLYSME